MDAILKIVNYYEVSPTKIVRKGSNVLTYRSVASIDLGAIVRIPIGKTMAHGVVLRQVAEPLYDTKPIEGILETTPLPMQLLGLAEWLSEYYVTPLAIVWQTLLPAGLGIKRRERHHPQLSSIRKRTHFILNNDQSKAVTTIDQSTGTHLLHGVTGSGKTAVYIALAKRSLDRDKSVIILVPEIALTSQLVDEFQQHFSDNIILTHSQQTPAQRHLTWQHCLTANTPQIILGPRSALFMPVQQLGLIVIDEAHEPSYKQDKSPRYSALRAASTLAHLHNAPLVLGSATPNLVDFYLAEQRQKITTLSHPARKPTPPEIVLVDATKKSEYKRHSIFSEKLLYAIDETLESKQQILIFHNRRGSTSTTLCEQCGWQAGCPTCLLPLTLHADYHQLRCHACGYSAPVPTSCPQCASTNITHRGIGTKLLEAELRKLYPKATIARFDADTVRSDTLDNRYAQVYRGDIDIIIGTQIIAKGLDLPNLRIVAIPQADAGLHLPDFASAERTFQLLSQVVGRVGRYNHPTRVIVQTYHPSHPVIHAGMHQDYAQFYASQLPIRHRSHFPPYTFLLKITATYKLETSAYKNLLALAKTLKTALSSLDVGQPTPAFYERVPAGFRWQLLVKSPRRSDLIAAIQRIPPGTHYQFDLDPHSLL